MLSIKLTLIALAVAAGLTVAIPTSTDYLSVPEVDNAPLSSKVAASPAKPGLEANG